LTDKFRQDIPLLLGIAPWVYYNTVPKFIVKEIGVFLKGIKGENFNVYHHLDLLLKCVNFRAKMD
jgi:hypothetical protein